MTTHESCVKYIFVAPLMNLTSYGNLYEQLQYIPSESNEFYYENKKTLIFIATHLKIYIMASYHKKIARLIIFTQGQPLIICLTWISVLIFQFFLHVIFIKSIIYLRVAAKDFDFSLSEGYSVRYSKTVSKIFDFYFFFFCNNKNQLNY